MAHQPMADSVSPSNRQIRQALPRAIVLTQNTS
jgi:hypothetical protein